MGKILDDMTRLREDMDRGHAERHAGNQRRADEVADLAAGVVDMIGGFATGRREQFGKDQAARGAFIGNLVQEVRDLGQEVGAMMDRVHDERMANAQADADARRQDVSDRVAEIRGKLGDFRDEMAAFRDEYAATAQQDARVRLGFVADKVHEVADLLGGFRREFDAQSAADGKARRDFVNGVADTVSETLRNAEEQRMATAEAGADARRAFMADVSTQVSALQHEVASDLAGIRGLFSGGAAPAAKPATKPPRGTAQRKPEPEPAKAGSAPEPAVAMREPKDAGAGTPGGAGATEAAQPRSAESKAMPGDGGGKRESKKQGNKADA